MKAIERRKFIGLGLTAVGAVTVASIGGLPFKALALTKAEGKLSGVPFTFVQEKLPYAFNALEPSIDAQTMEIHYSKHHAAYIKNVNEAIKAENLNFKDAADFFAHASSISGKARNNGGGAWNHNFFWACMKPSPAALSAGKLKTAIEKDFGSFDAFKAEFTKTALGQLGSGWAWLILDKGKLKIIGTANQDNPLMDNAAVKGMPLLAIDVWEHAYYLKYQNKRADYIEAFFKVIDWEQVSRIFSKA